MDICSFTVSQRAMPDATFPWSEVWPVIVGMGPALGRDYKRAQSFTRPETILEHARKIASRDGAFTAHLERMATLDREMQEHSAGTDHERYVRLVTEIDVRSEAAATLEPVRDPVIEALLDGTGVLLPKPPRGTEAVWKYDAYAGPAGIPLRYSGLPLGLPAILVRSNEDEGDDHYAVDWGRVQYLRIGNRRIPGRAGVTIMHALPETVRAALTGRRLRDIADLPGIGDAKITSIHGDDEDAFVVGIDLPRAA